MNLGIIRKTTREALPLLVIMTLAIVLLESLLVGVIGDFSKELEYLWLRRPIFERFARMQLGADLGGAVTTTGLMTIGFAHPLMFAFTWVFLLTTCSRVIVGEIERGTADLLLTLPVSRGAVYTNVSVVWMAAGVPVSLAPLLGCGIGQTIFELPEPLDFSRLAILAANLFALYLAVGSATLFVSTLVSRRALAVAFVLAWLLASFLLNFLAQFWSLADGISALGVLRYYRPLPVVQTGDWPVHHIAVLLGLGAFFWGGGLWRFARRDIPAV